MLTSSQTWVRGDYGYDLGKTYTAEALIWVLVLAQPWADGIMLVSLEAPSINCVANWVFISALASGARGRFIGLLLAITPAAFAMCGMEIVTVSVC